MKSIIVLGFCFVAALAVLHREIRSIESENSTPNTRLNTGNATVIWILGGPGSGKGTQCVKAAKQFNFTHMSIGSLLRAKAADGTKTGIEIGEIMKRGDLVPNEELVSVLKKAMEDEIGKTKGFLIDGYPRESSQGTAFEDSIASVDSIIYLDCKPEVMMTHISKRMNETALQRADDNEEAVKNRIDVFQKNIDDILSHYSTKIKRVDGNGDIETVFADFSEAISEILGSTGNRNESSNSYQH